MRPPCEIPSRFIHLSTASLLAGPGVNPQK
jgi:hypothetical protein